MSSKYRVVETVYGNGTKKFHIETFSESYPWSTGLLFDKKYKDSGWKYLCSCYSLESGKEMIQGFKDYENKKTIIHNVE